MKPRIGVYLSEQMAARLAAAAKRPGASKSALVEAALAQFFGSDDDSDNLPVDRRLSLMSRWRSGDRHRTVQSAIERSRSARVPWRDQGGLQLLWFEQLDRDLRVVNESVALQARYQLAVTPPLPAAALRAACALGSERFDEFATQVWRRVQSGTSLVHETVDRLGHKRGTLADGFGKGVAKTSSPVHEPDLRTSNPLGIEVEDSAAVREGGSLFNFPGKAGLPLH